MVEPRLAALPTNPMNPSSPSPTNSSASSRLTLIALIALAVLSGGVATADERPPLIAYVGTYTSPLQNMRATQVDLPPGNGRGIHLFKVDRETGELAPSGVYEMGTSPSALAFNADRTRLYSANETERIGADEAGSISAFEVDPDDGHLTLLNTVSSGGNLPT